MMKTLTSLVLLALVLAPAHAFADEINGKTPAICAVIETVECTADRKCQHRLAGHVNMPTFLRIDFNKKKKLTAAPTSEKTIVSEVKAFDTADGKLFLSGVKGGRGWSMVIDQPTGGMSLTLVGLDASSMASGRA